MQVILDSLFGRPGSAPIWGVKKGEFRDWTSATFDRNLIHSADASFLVMACVGYSRVQLRTLSSLLNKGSETDQAIQV